MSRQRSIEAIQAAEFVSIGELVRLTGARYSTLKFYTEEGLIPFKQDGGKLIRRYHREQSIDQINKLKVLREKGFTISQIKEKFY